MDIQIIREYLDLSITLSFSKTAERVFVSRSALSKHISNLERELGMELFFRDKQTVSLTPAGLALKSKLKEVVDAYDQALQIARKEALVTQGDLKVGFFPSPHVRSTLSKAITAFSVIYPAMNISPIMMEIGDLDSALKNHLLDIAISLSYPNSSVPYDTEYIPLYENRLCAAVGKNHPLSRQTSVSIEEISNYPLILPNHQQFSIFASLIEGFLFNLNKSLEIRCEYGRMEDAITLVESGAGVSILITELKYYSLANIHYLDITDKTPPVNVGIFFKKNPHNPQVAEFVQCIKEVFMTSAPEESAK